MGSRMKRIFRTFRGNDIVLRIYLSFAFVLALTAVLIGAIFLHLYEKNYLNSYITTLNRQSKVIATKVSRFSRNGKTEQFLKYSGYIDELETAEETDVWIVSNDQADNPLGEDFINADINSLTEEMYQVLDVAFQGKTSSSSNFDKVYGMMILRVATPVYADKEKTQVCGAVMMVSMLDRQRMGVKEGKYLITVSAVLALLVSYVVALGFSNYLSRPLGKIDRDIMKMADGDYSAINAPKRKTQLGRLEMALDGLAGRLRKIQEEREELDRVRQDFFANVSHELRTPITVIRGYSESLADGVITEENQVKDYYQRIVQECRGMERLVGDLFILSKMQNPDFKIEKEPVSLVQIFSDVIRNGRILGQEKNITIRADFPEEDPCLMLGDYDRLRQMFLVIVDNAVKFSHENGCIDITLAKSCPEAEQEAQKPVWDIRIRDYGIGIAQEQLPYVFEKFYKSKLKQNEKGTGLGLMIARQIALRHNGDIRVESKEGEGTTFFFRFEECSLEEAANF